MNAFDGAERKGRECARAGGKESDCPYKDNRGDWHNMVTFSRGFIRAWEDGFRDEVAKRK